MSKFTSQYVQLLKTESRISKSGIKPRNIYRLSVYRDGDPKSVKRFVFVKISVNVIIIFYSD